MITTTEDARTRKRLEGAGVFAEPESYEAGRELLAALKADIGDINVQLVERQDGEFPRSPEDIDWKKRALRARWYLKQRERFVRTWVADRRREMELANAAARDARRSPASSTRPPPRG